MEEIVIRSNIEHTKMVDTIAKELKEHNETISESSSQQEEERVQPQDWLHISEWLGNFKTSFAYLYNLLNIQTKVFLNLK